MSEAVVEIAGAKLNASDAHVVEGRFSLRTLQLGMAWFPEQPGGLDRYYFNLMERFAQLAAGSRGLVVGSTKVKEESRGGVRAFASPGESLLKRVWRSREAVAAELRGEPVEVIASHFALYAVAALGVIRRSGLPFVVHFHGPWAAECAAEGDAGVSNQFKKWIERRVYRSADLCIVLSDAFGKVLREDYGVAEGRIRVIPGGVEVERFRTTMARLEARRAMGWTEGPWEHRPILLTVRRLVPRMGLEVLLEAMKTVRRKHPDVLLLMAGRGKLADRLAQQISEFGLENNVQLLGFLPDEKLPLAMRAADLTVVPSIALEGFGLTVAESLAAGTPCLVSPVGGLPEVVRDLDPQLIFDKPEANAMAEKICAVLSGSIRLPSQDQCAAFAAARYDWDVIARRVLDVYAEAIRVHGVKPSIAND